MDVLEYVLKLIDQDLRVIEEDMADGKAKDFSDYKFHCGRVRGLLTAKGYIVDAIKRTHRDDDDDE